MQSEKRGSGRQTEETTTSFLRSTAGRYQDSSEDILAKFIDIETGVCLECGQVHGFTNIDEANNRRRRRGWRKNNSPYLDRLFWLEVPI
jgi:hypothetical protein